MSTTIEPVIAGSRSFALALLAPLTERIGTRPRIAAGAAQARPFCTGTGGLLVVEFLGADTLREIEALVREARGLRVVAAVPEKLAAAGAPLRALGVEVARWDGTPADVVGAVGRQLALAASAAIAPSPPRPPTRTPPPAPPPSRRAAPAARPAASPAAQTHPPVPAPPPPARPSSFAAAPEGTLVLTPASAPARSSSIAAAPAGIPALTPAPAPLPWKAEPPPAWPASIPGPVEAASALRQALTGAAGGGAPLAGIDEVVASLADVERAVLAGEPLPLDPEPIRRAAVTRVRVAAALATAPGTGQPVDAAGVSALLAEIDELLSRVNDLASGAPEDLQPSLEAVRNALVREAIDFSEVAQRASSAGAPAAAPAPRPAARPSKTRILSVEAEQAEGPRRAVAVWIALAAVVAAVAGYHGWNWHQRGVARATLSAGLPAGLTQIPGPPGGPRVLVRSSATEPPDSAEVARFKAAEEANGNTVRESDGMIFVEPARRDDAAPVGPPPKP